MIQFQEWNVRRKLGNARLRVEADMRLVDQEAKDTPRQRRLVKLNERAFLPGPVKRIGGRAIYELSSFRLRDGDIAPKPIQQSVIFRRMSDVWTHRAALQHSETYGDIRKTLETSGRFRHKSYQITDPSEIVEFINACYLDILTSMDGDGYLADRQSDFATGGVGQGLVDQQGRLISGPAATHRKAAAKIVGLEGGFPLRITAVHTGWLTDHGIKSAKELGSLPTLFNTVIGVVARA